MKYIYWNVIGLANPPSRLALQILISLHNLDFVFISEPWMDFEQFPERWITSLQLKMFALNNRPNRLSNIQYFCKISMNLVILTLDEQHVSFSIVDGHQTFVISVVYASTDYRKRRQLWNFFISFAISICLPMVLHM